MHPTATAHFDESHVLHELKHYLPSQQALKDFIHHNSLHAFQHMRFYEAVFKASAIFGFQGTLQLREFRQLYHTGRIKETMLEKVIAEKMGTALVTDWKDRLLHQAYETDFTPRIGRLRQYWKRLYTIDLDNKVHPLLFRLLCGFLDQGIASSSFPLPGLPFLEAMRALEQNSYTHIFKTKTVRRLFLSGQYTMEQLLNRVVGDPAYYEQYLFDQQFAHNGWSGFVSAVEDNPQTLLDRKQISLRELVLFELLLEMDALEQHAGKGWQPLIKAVDIPPMDLLADNHTTELATVLELWQDAFEWSYYDTVLAGILLSKKHIQTASALPSFQAIFCIDERECSLRRHLEASDPHCETMGAPGFFGVEFFFQQQGSKFYDKLCPAPVTPQYLIKEYEAPEHQQALSLYKPHAHGLLGGFLFSFSLGFWALVKSVEHLFSPKMSPAISNAYGHMHKDSTLTIENKNLEDRENGLQIGYTLDEMTTRAEGFLRGIGLIKNFSPIVYVVGHGSSSANNPHHGAHDCGACSGRPGATNARVQAFILNHSTVRQRLAAKGIHIPDTTHFVGCMHDTAADVVGYYDEEVVGTDKLAAHLLNKQAFETALNLNAKERSRRFASINTRKELEQVRKAILNRSVSLFEPRPELGHGTNTLCIVGRRQVTKGLFLDRRAFLNSYDCTTDPDGTILANVMRPIGLVCGGINLEYYFSRVDNIKMGAGTKLPHNVMGLFGVANSSDGDLRPGLPWQMIEVHDPVRLLVIVEHEPAIVLKAIQSTPEVFEWYKNEWVHIAALHPVTHELYYFKNGAFIPYTPITDQLNVIDNMHAFIEKAQEMVTNHIVDATKENLPVHLLN